MNKIKIAITIADLCMVMIAATNETAYRIVYFINWYSLNRTRFNEIIIDITANVPINVEPIKELNLGCNK